MREAAVLSWTFVKKKRVESIRAMHKLHVHIRNRKTLGLSFNTRVASLLPPFLVVFFFFLYFKVRNKVECSAFHCTWRAGGGGGGRAKSADVGS